MTGSTIDLAALRRTMLVLLAALGLTAALVPAPAAAAGGTVFASVTGQGTVTGGYGSAKTGGLSCAPGPQCSAPVPTVPSCHYNPSTDQFVCFSVTQNFSLESHAAIGWTFSNWVVSHRTLPIFTPAERAARAAAQARAPIGAITGPIVIPIFTVWTAIAGKCPDSICSFAVDEDYLVNGVFVDPPPTASLSTAPPAIVRGAIPVTAVGGDPGGAVSKVALIATPASGPAVEVGAAVPPMQSPADQPYPLTWNTAALPDGVYTFISRTTDNGGVTTDSAPISVTVDNTAPALAITGGPDGGAPVAPGAPVSWTFASSDATTGVAATQCKLDDAPYGPCSGDGSYAIQAPADGAHTASVRSLDRAGNPVEASHTFVVDNRPPVTSIGDGPAEDSVIKGDSVTFAFTSDEPGSTFQCRVYPSALTPPAFGDCSAAASHTATGFAPGKYAFEVRATDALGNLEKTGAKRTFTVAVSSPLTDTTRAQGSKVSVQYTFRRSLRPAWTAFTALKLLKVPSGATVTVFCKGGGCPKKAAKPVKASGTVKIRGLLSKRLRPGATITLTVKVGSSTVATIKIKTQKSKNPIVV